MKRLAFFILFALCCASKVLAQQDPLFSQYLFNQLYLNPAYAGINQDWNEATFIHRSQWLGYDATFDDGSAPSTQVLSLNMPFTKYNFGAGIHIANDRIGLFNTTEVQLNAAYHVKLRTGLLSFGLKGGFLNQRIDDDRLRERDKGDPQVDALRASNQRSEFASDFALGIYFNSARYFLGAALNHLLAPEFDYNTIFSQFSIQRHFNFIGGIRIEPNRELTITPSVLILTDFNTTSFEANVMAEYDEKYFGGVSLRELNAFVIMAGFYPLSNNRMRVGYSFDLVLGEQARNAKETSSHEISLTYRMPAVVSFGPRPIRSPRFRFE